MSRCRVSRWRCGEDRRMWTRHRSWATWAAAPCSRSLFFWSVVAVPLIIDRHASASDAIRASVRATLTNLPAMLVWALLIVALTVLGFVTLLVGMVIVAPLLGYATWHAYRDLIA